MSKSINRGSAAGDQRVTATQRGLVERLGGKVLSCIPALAIFASVFHFHMLTLLLLDSTEFQKF